ncbi:MAG: hypothetical protein ACXWUG_06645 [Polyangiales bacterium]
MPDEKKKKKNQDPPEPTTPDRTNTGEPRDVGYGPSHGHRPGHDGPSGPGDAPAK